MKTILRSLVAFFDKNETTVFQRSLAIHMYFATPRGALSC
jgi:hypothetical protein